MQQGRWVSYIYRYRNNVKCENAGFIKVQRIAHKTEDNVRIQIGLKLYKKRACTCMVYLLYDGNKAKHLMDIRFAAEERDTIMSRIEVPWQDPLRDGVSIDAYDGLFFRCDDGELLTGMWNEYIVQPEQVQVVEAAEQPEQPQVQAEPEALERQKPVERETSGQQEYTDNMDKIEPEGQEYTEPAEYAEPEVSGLPEQEASAAVQETLQEESAASGMPSGIASWQTMFDTYPKLPLFADSQFLECVKIAPQDIGRLAISNWRLGVNSFVSHGYYHYRYLMLGRVRFEQGECVVIGVPGVFTNKEKYLANMFGFDTFIPVKKTSVLTGNFGYWVSEVLKE